MSNNNLLIGSIGTTLSFVGTAMQTNEVLQTISIIITIIGGLITVIIMPLVNQNKRAKKDGKIDTEEVKYCNNINVVGSEKIKEEIDKKQGQ